jgi:1-acyl-sn-glycerol-3-phosphate acyltransferase
MRPKALDHAWRVFATGLSFFTFGLGGLALYLIALPLLRVLVPVVAKRQRTARRLIHWLFRFFVRFMWLLGVLRFRIRGAERLRRPGLVIVANHPTLLDVVFLISVVPDANCIVKASLASNPFTRAAVSITGYVCNDWGVELVESCVRSVRSGSSLIVFPEGTRSNAPAGGRWHRGAANISLRAGVALTPVCIRCEPPSLRKGEPWWQVPPRRMRYTLDVLDDLAIGNQSPGRELEVGSARELTDRLRDLLGERREQNVGA